MKINNPSHHCPLSKRVHSYQAPIYNRPPIAWNIRGKLYQNTIGSYFTLWTRIETENLGRIGINDGNTIINIYI